ncbi:MAG TPA: TrkA C-terminal domain-containing protein, partial [Micromonosporaceae bacterium]|nr:TrkA C-terminal domain-containing protein [Micromonosporaceae bacterium]
TISIMEVPIDRDWVGKPLRTLEEATGTRAAYVMRFGIGTLPTASTVIQEGDQVFMLVTDEMIEAVTKISGAPEGGH